MQWRGIQFNYWSGTAGTEFDSNFAWNFIFNFGEFQSIDFKVSNLFGWAVRSGDVAAVPEPGTVLLMAMGLVGLGVARRSRRAT